ncbi:MAG TPA: VOC family protein [Caulifigura sp.]|nr:VOC family protein [Caulifigura sp.]
MKTNPVGWFEIACNDLKRASAFYKNVFGFEMTDGRVNEYEMVFFPMDHQAAGTTGALVQGKGHEPTATGTIVYFPVEDIPATLVKVEQAGGKTLFPKKSIGPHGFIAWFSDSEGNSIGLHSRG